MTSEIYFVLIKVLSVFLGAFGRYKNRFVYAYIHCCGGFLEFNPLRERCTGKFCPNPYCGQVGDHQRLICRKKGDESPLWECNSCKSWNLPATTYCRQCREKREVEGRWIQESCNQFRTGALIPNLKYDASITQNKAWAFQSDGNVDNQDMPPSMVATSEALIYYNTCSRAFESRSIRKEEDDFGKLLWRSNIFQRLDYTSSPVIHESLLYFITCAPNYLHRISIATGKRQVCKLKLNDKIEHELPGTIFKNCTPLFYEFPQNYIPRKILDKLLIVLTNKGLCLFELMPLSKMPKPEIRGFFFEKNFEGHQWSRPTAIGNYIIATSRNKSYILCIDLADYPREPDIKIIPISGLNGKYDQNTPCIAYRKKESNQKFSACWVISNDLNNKSKLVFYDPPGTFETKKIPYIGRLERHKMFSPVTDGRTVYMPYNKENSRGISSYNNQIQKTLYYKLPSELTSYFTVLGRNQLLVPNATELTRFKTNEVNPSLQSVGTYANDGAESVCCSRPIIVEPNIFVQCNNLIACFEMAN